MLLRSTKNPKKLLYFIPTTALATFVLYSWYRRAAKSEEPTPKLPKRSVPSRHDQLVTLKKQPFFDILVIGGGATGSGVALDSITRGLSTALVERDDFASGTSSRSTKLIHGGVRYLEKAIKNLDYSQWKLVDQALRERSTLLKLAPHLSHPLPIMMPSYTWFSIPYYWVGVKIYDFVAGTQRALPPSHFITRDESIYQFPMLKEKGLKGAVVYYDGQHDDARMNLSIALTAAEHGAVTVNHVEVIKLLRDKNDDKKIIGAVVCDNITGDQFEVYAKVIVNATGPFTDSIRQMEDPKVPKMIEPSSGVHVILPDHYSPDHMGLIIPKTRDGRVLFFLPWQNSTIAGTTDSSSEITALPAPQESEINFILEEVSKYLKIQVKREDVKAAWSGLRPLAKAPTVGGKTEAISRDHVVVVSEGGIVTVCGGKWTTYRKMAEDAVDKAIEVGKLNPLWSCQTGHIYLYGGEGYNPRDYQILLRKKYHYEKDVAEHLASSYGTKSELVAILSPMRNTEHGYIRGTRLNEEYPFIEAEIRYCCRNEYAVTVVDMIARRIRLSFLNTEVSEEVLPRVVEIMSEELHWDKKRQQQEIEQAKIYLKTMR